MRKRWGTSLNSFSDFSVCQLLSCPPRNPPVLACAVWELSSVLLCLTLVLCLNIQYEVKFALRLRKRREISPYPKFQTYKWHLLEKGIKLSCLMTEILFSVKTQVVWLSVWILQSVSISNSGGSSLQFSRSLPFTVLYYFRLRPCLA